MTDLPTMELPDPDPTVLQVLREWRQQRAREDQVPPWVVMTNGLMEQIATLRPTTEDELLALKGMGPGRMWRYGSDLLALMDSVPLDAVPRPTRVVALPTEPAEHPDPPPPPAMAPRPLVPEREAETAGRRGRRKRGVALEDLMGAVGPDVPRSVGPDADDAPAPFSRNRKRRSSLEDLSLGMVPDDDDEPAYYSRRGRGRSLELIMEDDHEHPQFTGNRKRRSSPDPIEISDATPFTVAIEYRITEEVRQKLVSELEHSRGPASLGLCRVLEAGPAQMTLRVQWQS